MHHDFRGEAGMPVIPDDFAVRLSTLMLFVLSGLLSGASGLYVLGGYSNGLPSAWWSGPLVLAVLGASATLVAAGLSTLISQSVSRVLALLSGGLLEIVFVATVLELLILTGAGNTRAGISWGPLVLLVILPLMLTTASLVVAWRSS